MNIQPKEKQSLARQEIPLEAKNDFEEQFTQHFH